LKKTSGFASYVLKISPLYFAVFVMRFSFSFTVVALQWIIPNPFDRGVVSAAYPFMEMSSALFLGLIIDRFGRKWIIVSALIASSVVSFTFTLSRAVGSLILIHAVQGVLASAIVISTLALLTDTAKVGSRGREMGIYDFSTIAGYGLGFLFAILLISGNPLRADIPFYVGALVALCGGVICALILKDSRPIWSQLFSARQNLREIATSKSTLSLLPTWFVLMTLIGVALTYTREITSILIPGQFPIFGHGLTESTNLRVGIETAIIFLLGIGLLALSQTSFGSLSDRIGRTKVALIGQVSLLGILLTLSAAIVYPLNKIIILLLLALFGIGLLAFAPAALAELADVAPETGRASTMGLYSLTIGAGTIFGPLAGGALLAEYGISTGFSVLFASLALLMVVIIIPRLGKNLDSEKNIF
jgi:MFS family permease